jgi:transcriptional regulator with XRE-family HTH domain
VPAPVLQQAYRADLCQRANQALGRLQAVCSQRRLERMIDLSQGYLSHLKAGRGVPSAALVSLLAVLAAEPSRLQELETYWALSPGGTR